MIKHTAEVFGDVLCAKAILSTALGFSLGMVGLTLEEANLWASLIFSILGSIAFIAAFIISLPKLFELGSKVLKAIRTTFDNDESN